MSRNKKILEKSGKRKLNKKKNRLKIHIILPVILTMILFNYMDNLNLIINK